LQREGIIPTGVKFQISLPTPISPTYNSMVPTDRPALIPVLTTHMLGEVTAIPQALPNDRIALQWDVYQEVIAWEGYYEPGPVRPDHARSIRYKAGVRKPWKKEPAVKR
jgi:hypothetical protein